MHDIIHPKPYRLSFSAASLRPELARIIAEAYLSCGNWDDAKEKVLSDNALQARSAASAKRMEREIRQRIQTLTPQQIDLLANGSTDSRGAMAWLAALKHIEFIYTFAAQTLRAKIEILDFTLRPSDYEDFIASQSAIHPELAELKPSTQDKVKRVTMTMLREAGILSDKTQGWDIARPFSPTDAQDVIIADNRFWLAGFLVPDEEIRTL